MADNCYAYLESIEDLSSREVTCHELVEFKWKGITAERVSIPPAKSRFLDAFYVPHNFPNIAYFGINRSLIDYSRYYHLYRLDEPGTFDLTYVVFSETFSPARATFRLRIGNSLDDIEFVHAN